MYRKKIARTIFFIQVTEQLSTIVFVLCISALHGHCDLRDGTKYERCVSSLLMHRRIRLGGFCGPIAVTSQGMRDVNCWAAFFNEKFPWWLWCLASWVKLVYPRLRMWWLRIRELSRFFPLQLLVYGNPPKIPSFNWVPKFFASIFVRFFRPAQAMVCFFLGVFFLRFPAR